MAVSSQPQHQSPLSEHHTASSAGKTSHTGWALPPRPGREQHINGCDVPSASSLIKPQHTSVSTSTSLLWLFMVNRDTSSPVPGTFPTQGATIGPLMIMLLLCQKCSTSWLHGAANSNAFYFFVNTSCNLFVEWICSYSPTSCVWSNRCLAKQAVRRPCESNTFTQVCTSWQF